MDGWQVFVPPSMVEGDPATPAPERALVLISSFDVGRQRYATRRANAADVVFSADGTTFAADNLIVSLRVPCNSSEAAVTVRYTLRSPT